MVLEIPIGGACVAFSGLTLFGLSQSSIISIFASYGIPICLKLALPAAATVIKLGLNCLKGFQKYDPEDVDEGLFS